MTEYGDATLRRETEHPQDKITYDAEFADLSRKLDRVLEILASSAAQVLPPPDQEF